MTEILPTARELELLKILWRRGRATVREIHDALRTKEERLAYTTVLSLMQTMEQKGLVAHESPGKAYVYSAQVEQEQTFSKLAGQLLDRVFDGAIDQYVVRALESRSSDLEELKQLEQMIAAAREPGCSRHSFS